MPTFKVTDFEFGVEIGKGGFGTVYEATHPILGKVAIKKIPRNAAGANRIESECRLMERVRHSQIVEYLGYFSDNKNHYVAMELCEFGSLRNYVKSHGPLNGDSAAYILAQVIRAVKECHRLNIMHRDLSAGNILIKSMPKDDTFLPKVKICDFGLARTMNENKPAQTYAGTPGYMPPEMVKGQGYSEAADVYALGGVLYFMLTGLDPPSNGIIDANRVHDVNARDLLLEMIAPEISRIPLQKVQRHIFMKSTNMVIHKDSSVYNSTSHDHFSEQRNPHISDQSREGRLARIRSRSREQQSNNKASSRNPPEVHQNRGAQVWSLPIRQSFLLQAVEHDHRNHREGAREILRDTRNLPPSRRPSGSDYGSGTSNDYVGNDRFANMPHFERGRIGFDRRNPGSRDTNENFPDSLQSGQSRGSNPNTRGVLRAPSLPPRKPNYSDYGSEASNDPLGSARIFSDQTCTQRPGIVWPLRTKYLLNKKHFHLFTGRIMVADNGNVIHEQLSKDGVVLKIIEVRMIREPLGQEVMFYTPIDANLKIRRVDDPLARKSHTPIATVRHVNQLSSEQSKDYNRLTSAFSNLGLDVPKVDLMRPLSFPWAKVRLMENNDLRIIPDDNNQHRGKITRKVKPDGTVQYKQYPKNQDPVTVTDNKIIADVEKIFKMLKALEDLNERSQEFNWPITVRH